MIAYTCARCGETLETDDALSMQTETCPVCGHVNAVPKSTAPTSWGHPHETLKSQKAIPIGCSIGCLGVVIFLALMMAINFYIHGPAPVHVHKTNQERLDEYHKKGKFLGYKDGDELAKDIENLKKAQDEIEKRGY